MLWINPQRPKNHGGFPTQSDHFWIPSLVCENNYSSNKKKQTETKKKHKQGLEMQGKGNDSGIIYTLAELKGKHFQTESDLSGTKLIRATSDILQRLWTQSAQGQLDLNHIPQPLGPLAASADIKWSQMAKPGEASAASHPGVTLNMAGLIVAQWLVWWLSFPVLCSATGCT